LLGAKGLKARFYLAEADATVPTVPIWQSS